MRVLYKNLVLALLIALTGCETAPDKKFERVQNGMDKSSVIEAVGGPDHSRRWQGKDRWIYILKKPLGEEIKEIHFEDGHVVYVGSPPAPKISAEEQDRLNEESNDREEQRMTKEREAERKARSTSDTKPIAPAEEAVKHVPVFEPIQ